MNQPVLMINGKYDMFFQVETSQKPFFRILGTPGSNKRMITHQTGHIPPRTEVEGETLKWFDQYLGPVNKDRFK